jgi:hypothetical protein
MSVLVILAVFSADGYRLAEDVLGWGAEKNEDRDPICRRMFPVGMLLRYWSVGTRSCSGLSAMFLRQWPP